MSVITQLADGITRMEGYYAGTRAFRNNNPGNLRASAIYPQYPVDDGGFTIFPTAAAGRAALEADMQAKVNRGMTLQSLVYQYAPPTDNNDSAAYVANMANWTGLPTNVPLNSLNSPDAPQTYTSHPDLPVITQPSPDTGSISDPFSGWVPDQPVITYDASGVVSDNTPILIAATLAGLVLFLILRDD